jgi:hypothetical protein
MKRKNQNLRPKATTFIVLILVIYLCFTGLRNFLFFNRKDRLNLIFYGENTAFYSFGFKDGVNYFISYPADVKVLVPGGFGMYRLGGLGKLVSLENKPDIFKKTFSDAVGCFVDYYFYPVKNAIYFSQEKKEVFFPKPTAILFNKSNTTFFDRLYIFLLFMSKSENNFKQISDLPVLRKDKDLYFDEKKFYDQQLGFFYQESMRQEKANVQIIYSENEENANLISKIIEGQGIRVVDISYRANLKNCLVLEDKNQTLKTTEMLANFFNCSKKKAKTNPFDIILELGEREKDWALF